MFSRKEKGLDKLRLLQHSFTLFLKVGCSRQYLGNHWRWEASMRIPVRDQAGFKAHNLSELDHEILSCNFSSGFKYKFRGMPQSKEISCEGYNNLIILVETHILVRNRLQSTSSSVDSGVFGETKRSNR